MALLIGGLIALLLAAELPGAPAVGAVILLMVAAGVMTAVASIVGFAPTMAAGVVALSVVALSDPMLSLGATIDDFSLAWESLQVFAVYGAAAMIGALLRVQLRRRREAARRCRNWRVTP